VISLIGNRPALKVGRFQVLQYDTSWLAEALRRAALAADQKELPCLDEIRRGIETYLESKCTLRLLPIEDLYDKLRHMLKRIGFDHVAEKLEVLAPPVTLSLVRVAKESDCGMELAFFETLRRQLNELRSHGAEDVRFTGLRDCVLILHQKESWDQESDRLFSEIQAFLQLHQPRQRSMDRPVRYRVEAER
jgi:hypothetical protein